MISFIDFLAAIFELYPEEVPEHVWDSVKNKLEKEFVKVTGNNLMSPIDYSHLQNLPKGVIC